MTNAEAIKLLRKLRDTIDRNNKYGEAEEMAIQALEQINKVADLLDGTIDHFDNDDAMDLLYEIKEVIR